ncbi:MAG TPA: CAP domain-containing protein, partial [Candidatus Paceibacterota bacterium]
MNDMRPEIGRALAGAGVLVVAASIALAISTIREGMEALPVAAVNASSVVSLTNEERAVKNLPALERNALLDLAARLKAEDMATKGYYAHVAPDGTTPMDFVNRSGYRYRIIGENLVVERTSADQVVEAFMGSPGHRANILRKDFTEIGVGTAEGTHKGKDAIFTVQIFAAPLATAQSSKEVVKPTSKVPEGSELPKAPVVTVPRPQAEQKPKTPAPVLATTTLSIAPLGEKVKEILKPLTMPLEATTTASTSSRPLEVPAYTPSFPITFSEPSVFEDVSRLEVKTPSVAASSTWIEDISFKMKQILLTLHSLVSKFKS